MGRIEDAKEALKRNIVPIVGVGLLLGGILYVPDRQKTSSPSMRVAGRTVGSSSEVVASRGLPMVRQLLPAIKSLWSRIAVNLPHSSSDSK